MHSTSFKKITFIYVTIFVTALLAHAVLGTIANAQEEATSTETSEALGERATAREANMANRAETFEANKAQREEIRTERRARLQQNAQTRITNLAANMSNRMEAFTRRLENVIGRLESRTTKMDERGLDTTQAKAALVIAKSELNTAKNLLTNIDADVATVVGSENPREAWLSLKAKFSTIRDAIKAAHTAIKDSIVALRASADRQTDTAEAEETEVSE